MKSNNSQQYFSAKQILDRYQITSQTLYNWRKNKDVDFHKLPSGSYVYSLPKFEFNDVPRKHVLYARVSNTKQKEDLDR